MFDSILQVSPVVFPAARGLCRKAYPGHPKGCPNWGKRDECPPRAPLLPAALDLTKPVFCIYNRFDFGSHVARMRQKHPEWSERQVRCCLYWQNTARKALRQKVEAFLKQYPEHIVLYVPEACGVNVTATMATLDIELEWPPESVAYQVALTGMPAHSDE